VNLIIYWVSPVNVAVEIEIVEASYRVVGSDQEKMERSRFVELLILLLLLDPLPPCRLYVLSGESSARR
jgi:hypothetical protein